MPALINAFRNLDQYQFRYNSILNFRFSNNTLVSINPDMTPSEFSELNLELEVLTNTIVNIKPDTTQSVFSGI